MIFVTSFPWLLSKLVFLLDESGTKPWGKCSPTFPGPFTAPALIGSIGHWSEARHKTVLRRRHGPLRAGFSVIWALRKNRPFLLIPFHLPSQPKFIPTQNHFSFPRLHEPVLLDPNIRRFAHHAPLRGTLRGRRLSPQAPGEVAALRRRRREEVHRVGPVALRA